jgi:WD40 repeat protein
LLLRVVHQDKPDNSAISQSQDWEYVHTLTGHSDWVTSVVISPDGNTLATSSYDQTIKLWKLNSGELLHTFNHSSSLIKLSFRNPYVVVAISPDGQNLASGDEANKAIKIWDLNAKKELKTFQKDINSGLKSIIFSPNRQTLITGHTDGTINLINLSSGNLLYSLKHSPGLCLSISTDGKTLTSGSKDKVLKVWNVNTGELLNSIKHKSGSIKSISISSDGKTIASGSTDRTVKLWNTSSAELLRTLSGHSDEVRAVAISPDGKTLASGSDDKTIKLWSTRTGMLIHTFSVFSQGVNSIAFSSTGQYLIGGSKDKTIRVWRLE